MDKQDCNIGDVLFCFKFNQILFKFFKIKLSEYFNLIAKYIENTLKLNTKLIEEL